MGFSLYYLPDYLKLPPADFHPEMVGLLGDHTERALEILGFRGSAKTTFGSLALPIWAALEHPKQYPFIIMVSNTNLQAKTNVQNLQYELENNQQIRDDYAGSLGEKDTWQKEEIVLSNGVRILARSKGQPVRGLIHRGNRPSLVIIDDPEDEESVRTKESRDKTENWLNKEVIPGVEEKQGRVIVIGNLIHMDSLMARLRDGDIFKTREYPLITKGGHGKVTWKGKYPDKKSLESQRAKVGESSWMREYLLKVIPSEGQEVQEEWIHYYHHLPQERIIAEGTGVDLAISKSETADYTAMVSGMTARVDEQVKIFIYPQPVNERLSFYETQEQAKVIAQSRGAFHQFFIEDVAYQKAAIEELRRNGINAVSMRAGTDKRARLRAVARYIQDGTIVFPDKGCRDLIIQLCYFGIEEHDDLVDSFCYLVLGLLQSGLQEPIVEGI